MTSWRSFVGSLSAASAGGSTASNNNINNRKGTTSTSSTQGRNNHKRPRSKANLLFGIKSVGGGSSSVVVLGIFLFAAAMALAAFVLVVDTGFYDHHLLYVPTKSSYSDSQRRKVQSSSNNNKGGANDNNKEEDKQILRHSSISRKVDNNDNEQQIQREEQCSCISSTRSTDNKCCDRKMLRAHKMGVVLLRELFPAIPSEIIDPSVLEGVVHHDENNNANKHKVKDYRHVVVTRPIYDSIVSGYLYHKSGRECWLDQHGRPRAVNKTFEWQSELTLPLLPVLEESENNERVVVGKVTTLCEYLSKTNEQDGLRAYVDFALSSLYKGLMPHRKLVHEIEREQQKQHTLFICFANLENKDTKLQTYQKVMNFLYPGGMVPEGMGAFPRGGSSGKDNGSAAAAAAGGHGTSRDLVLRQRLVSIIQSIDKEHFNGKGSKATDAFGCDKSKERKAPKP